MDRFAQQRGHTVTRRNNIQDLDTNVAGLADLEAADLVIISRDTNSGNYSSNATEIDRWNALTTPLIVMNPQVVRASDRWRWFESGVLANAAGFTMHVEEAGHPIFAGIALDANNEFEFADVGVSNTMASTTAGNGTVLATDPGNANVWIASWPTGAEFWAGGPIAGGPRIFFGAGAGIASDDPKGGENLTADGVKAFLNTINLLTNSVPAGPPHCRCRLRPPPPHRPGHRSSSGPHSPAETTASSGASTSLARPPTVVMQSSVPSAGTETTGTVTVAESTQIFFLVVKENRDDGDIRARLA